VHGATGEVVGSQPEGGQRDERKGEKAKQGRENGRQRGLSQYEKNSGAKRRIGSRCAKHGEFVHGTVSTPAVNPTSAASSVSYLPPGLLAPEEDARWFSDQIRPHEVELRSYLRGRFPSLVDVDDLVQETYSRMLRARAGGGATLTRAYLFVVARNVALDQVRRNKVVAFERWGDLAESSVVEERPDAAETLSHKQELALLAAAMHALPPRCREILTLRRIEGWSHRAIAQKLGIAEGTVNAQLAIGLVRCRQFLCEHGVVRACLNHKIPAAADVR